jgi:anti-anti-sigma factor
MSESELELETMKATHEELKRSDVITLVGRIDSSNATQLDNFLKTNLVDRGHYNIVVEMSGVTYVSSAGLRALVALQREASKHRGRVVLAAPSDRVDEVMKLAGLQTLFPSYPDTTQAVGSF